MTPHPQREHMRWVVIICCQHFLSPLTVSWLPMLLSHYLSRLLLVAF
jgi:hypothetical protein